MIQSQSVRQIVHKSTSTIFAVIVGIGLLASASRGLAADLTWTNGTDVWTSPTAWTTNLYTGIDPIGLTNVTCAVTASNATATCVGGTGGYPSSEADRAFFTNSTECTVTIDASTDIGRLMTSNSTGVITFKAGANMLTVTGQVQIGINGSTSTVYWAGGTLRSQSLPSEGLATFRIGETNSYGELIVTNGVVIFDSNAGGTGLGVGVNSAGSGKLVITGSGVVTNTPTTTGGSLTVGSGSPNSQLIITNGGKLFVYGLARIGNGGALASNNLALFSGANSVWTNVGGVVLGSRGNTLIVSNGAKLFSSGGTIGGGQVCNTAIVVRAGSWVTTGGLGGPGNFLVGTSSSGSTNNALIVYDGGFFSCSGSLAFGNAAPSVSNTIRMGGTGAMSTGFAVVVRNASGATSNNLMAVSNAVFTCSRLIMQGGPNTLQVLEKGTFVISNQYAISATQTNVFDLNTGNGSVIIDGGTINAASGSNALSITIGSAATLSGNTMTIFNGGKLLSEQATLGTSWFNTGVVTGVGSVWSNATPGVSWANTNILTVGSGSGGSNNYLAVSDGARLYNNGTFNIGTQTNAMYNTVVFGGAGVAAVIVNTGSLNIGSGSGTSQNSLTVSNATVNAGTINVGNSGAVSNSLVFRGGTIAFNFMRARPTNTVTFSAGTFSAGAITVDSLANNGQGLVVGDGVSAAYYDMVAGGSGLHDFNVGLVVTNGAALLGSGELAGNVTVLGTFVPGGNGVGTVVASNNFTFGSSAVLNYNLGTLSDSVSVYGDLALGTSTVNVANSGGFTATEYVLFTHTNTVTAPSGTLTVGTLPANFVAAVSNDLATARVLLIVTNSAPADSFVTWQGYYGLSGGAAAGTADPDGDGMNNTNEFLAGFNPTNSAASPRVISIVSGPGQTNAVITYLGASGDSTYAGGPTSRTNVLESTLGTPPSFTSTNFVSTGLTNILSGGTGLGSNVTVTVSGGLTNRPARYYRVRVLVP